MKYIDLTRKAIKLIVFVIIVLFLYTQLTYIYRGELSHTRKSITGFYAEEKDSLDVVILGTSSTFSAVMPMELWGKYGITSYDMCTNVLFEEAIKYHVKELQKTQHPKLLIIDTAPFLYGHKANAFLDTDSHLRYNTDGFSLSWNRFDLINAVIPRGKRFEYYFDLLYYHGNSEPSIEYLFNKHTNIYKGYNNLPQNVSFDESVYMANTGMMELPEEDKKYFLDLLDELKSFDGDILFVEWPVFYTEEIAGICGESEYMEAKVKEYGYDYLDLSKIRDEIDLDSRFDYSLDFLHFHAFSAEKITNYLGEYLSANYDLADHRSDADYQNWQEQYAQWEAIKEEEKNQVNEEQMAHFQEAGLQEYLGYLQSDYYSSCIYIPADAEIWTDPLLVKQFKENGTENQDYFRVNDHSADLIIEKTGKENLEYNSTFGYVQYDNLGDRPELYINGSESNYLEGGNGGIYIILVRKSTGEIVDIVCFHYNDEQEMWERNSEFGYADFYK